MGIYINPEDMSKEDWLAKHAAEGPFVLMPKSVPDGSRRVCLVHNKEAEIGFDFTAAGVAFNEDEAARFDNPCGRKKLWFIVEDKKLEEVTGVTLPSNRPLTGKGRL